MHGIPWSLRRPCAARKSTTPGAPKSASRAAVRLRGAHADDNAARDPCAPRMGSDDGLGDGGAALARGDRGGLQMARNSRILASNRNHPEVLCGADPRGSACVTGRIGTSTWTRVTRRREAARGRRPSPSSTPMCTCRPTSRPSPRPRMPSRPRPRRARAWWARPTSTTTGSTPGSTPRPAPPGSCRCSASSSSASWTSWRRRRQGQRPRQPRPDVPVRQGDQPVRGADPARARDRRRGPRERRGARRGHRRAAARPLRERTGSGPPSTTA